MATKIYIDSLILKTDSCFIRLSPWRHWFTSRPDRVSYMVENLAFFSPHWVTLSSAPGPPHYRGFAITFRHTRPHTHNNCMTPLDEGSARHKDQYLTTHCSHNRQTSMPAVRFKAAIPASQGPQTHVLDRAATGKAAIPVSQRPQTHVLDRAATGIGRNICSGRGFSLSIPIFLCYNQRSVFIHLWLTCCQLSDSLSMYLTL